MKKQAKKITFNAKFATLLEEATNVLCNHDTLTSSIKKSI